MHHRRRHWIEYFARWNSLSLYRDKEIMSKTDCPKGYGWTEMYIAVRRMGLKGVNRNNAFAALNRKMTLSLLSTTKDFWFWNYSSRSSKGRATNSGGTSSRDGGSFRPASSLGLGLGSGSWVGSSTGLGLGSGSWVGSSTSSSSSSSDSRAVFSASLVACSSAL